MTVRHNIGCSLWSRLMVLIFDLSSLPFTSRRPCKDQFGEWTRLSQPCSSTGISITTYIQNFDTIVIKRPKMQMHGVPENGGVTTTFQQHHHLQNFYLWSSLRQQSPWRMQIWWTCMVLLQRSSRWKIEEILVINFFANYHFSENFVYGHRWQGKRRGTCRFGRPA